MSAKTTRYRITFYHDYHGIDLPRAMQRLADHVKRASSISCHHIDTLQLIDEETGVEFLLERTQFEPNAP